MQSPNLPWNLADRSAVRRVIGHLQQVERAQPSVDSCAPSLGTASSASRLADWASVVGLLAVLMAVWGASETTTQALSLIWLTGGSAVALLPCALAASDRRRLGREAAISFGVVAPAYAPWVSTLAFQASHTGAPWSPRPHLRQMVSVVGDLLGDPHERVFVLLLFVAGPMLWAIVGFTRTAA